MTRAQSQLVVAAGLILAVGCAKGARPAEKAADSTSSTAATARSATPAVNATTVATALDTARGVISVVGNEPVSALVLTLASTDAPLALVGEPSARLLRTLSGVEVVVFGRQTADVDRTASPRGALVFRVERFLVRALDGVAAEDGELVSTTSGFSLRRSDGKELKITSLPPALRARVGARVYLVGPLNREAVAYGVIGQ